VNIKRKINCTFPQTIIQEPLLYNLGKNFAVVPNIRGASVTEEGGFMVLEMEGDEEEIGKVVAYLASRGVKVDEQNGSRDGRP
jgi:ABC-type methionine transport system ATPase subunit